MHRLQGLCGGLPRQGIVSRGKPAQAGAARDHGGFLRGARPGEKPLGQAPHGLADPALHGMERSGGSASQKRAGRVMQRFRAKAPSPLRGSKDGADIVIVGSGIGGMAAGALFARQGYTVRVLEQHRELIGGHGRCLRLNGLEFSMGPQYVWDFGGGQLGDRFLDFLGIKAATPFLPMQADGFERIFVGERHKPAAPFVDVSVPLGLDNFRRRMEALFPSEKKRIGAFFFDMTGIYQDYARYYRACGQRQSRFLQTARLLLAGDVAAERKLRFGGSVFQSLRGFFDQYGISPLLRRILYG